MAIAVRDLIEADPESAGLSPAGLANLAGWSRQQVDLGHIPGVITMVARHGKVVYADAYGSMDVEAGKSMAPDAIFRIYSMTKPIVSVGLMMLYEEGRFQLDDPVLTFIPEWQNLKVFVDGTAAQHQLREPVRPPTVRDLLMHTGGLPGLYSLQGSLGMPMSPAQELHFSAGIHTFPDTFPGNHDTLRDMALKMAQVPLEADPGANWIYGLSTDMVGYLCEVLSGRPLDRYLDERILQPLGMTDTAFQVAHGNVERLTACYRTGLAGETAYVLQDSPATSRFTRTPTLFSGVAGLTSTAADYMRFAKMLANGGELDGVRILGPRTLGLMGSNHLPAGQDLAAVTRPGPMPPRVGQGFGLGFGVLLDPARAGIIGTPGEISWGGAASTAFFVSPRDELVGLLMTQLLGGVGFQFATYLRSTLYPALLD
ncbi:MAG TPA: serine hydrolase domain-containing protein [Chloroflexota bacterium]|nr:serine hydrolase domain-containing protein [Chloroflexota bacterium]